MNRKSQFPIAYLFWETFWIAATLGLGRIVMAFSHPILVLESIVLFAKAGAAIGGVFGQMDRGALAGLILWLLSALAVIVFVLCLIMGQ